MRMKKNILYTLALLSIFASCAKTELPHFGGENDPDAVVISPSVAVLSSKSNPLSKDNIQLMSFNEGDIITIKDLSDNEVYTYKLTNGSWKSTNGKCLLWHSESLNIEASYGSKGEGDRGVEDQSDAEKIALADYMTYSGTVTRIDGNELSFTLERKQALVTVVIKSYGDQYNPDVDKISDLKFHSIIPYIRDASGNYTDVRDNGTVGYRYSAIVPGGQSLGIFYKVHDQDRKVIDPLNQTHFDAGNSYTINLRVGKDKLEVGDISVSDWGSTDWGNAEADIDAPYVTFSADSEQKFSMDFRGFNGNFTLGEGEYFEYSVGGGEWKRFTTTLSEPVAFGSSLGDLRLRGKSSKGTATDNIKYSNIKFSTADVMVKCTGDIRTLIDYTDYTGVGTSSAKFCSLFHLNTLLTTAPELPATDLKDGCYDSMFYGCTSLTEAPELPATKLVSDCYRYMFYNCSSLSKVIMLATEVSASDCLDNWLYNAGTSASSRTLMVENDDVYYTISANSNYLPDNWKSGQATINYRNFTPYVTFSAASEQKFSMTFNSFTLGENEYFEYSVGGSAWTKFTENVSDVAFGCSNGDLRLRGKSSKGTAEEERRYSIISFTTDNVPVYCTGDIRTLIDHEAYQTVSTANAMFCNLFYNNSVLVTAPELPATDLADYCYLGMFQGCKSLTSAPVLPAETLKTECYEVMFAGCTALSSVTMLATNVSASNCLTDWLNNAGISATSRTLTVASKDAYNSIVGTLPDIWKQDAENTTVNFQNN